MRASSCERALRVSDPCMSVECSVYGGELFERAVSDNFVLTERACVCFARQICEGVAFIHSRNIVHLDMKVGQPLQLDRRRPLIRPPPPPLILLLCFVATCESVFVLMSASVTTPCRPYFNQIFFEIEKDYSH